MCSGVSTTRDLRSAPKVEALELLVIFPRIGAKFQFQKELVVLMAKIIEREFPSRKRDVQPKEEARLTAKEAAWASPTLTSTKECFLETVAMMLSPESLSTAAATTLHYGQPHQNWPSKSFAGGGFQTDLPGEEFCQAIMWDLVVLVIC